MTSTPPTAKALYEKYGPTIYSRCRRLLKDPIAAEDATQEVFLKVISHLDSAPEERAVLAWIYRITTNYCLNLIRDSRRQATPVEEVPDHGSNRFEEDLLTKDLTDRLMAGTPEQLKTPVMLFHVKGMEQAQIADALGVSRRTVLYRLSEFTERARAFVDEAEAFA